MIKQAKMFGMLIIRINLLETPTSRFNDTNDENEWTA